MITYNKAHELAELLGRSEEYQSYAEAKMRLEQDLGNLEMLERFRQEQWEIQMARIAGQEVDELKVQKAERLYQLLSMNPKVNDFLNAEYRLARILADIQRIIAEAVPAWFEFNKSGEFVN